ncbi:MAG: YceI family protein [Saprospiraceae bacterium]
MKIFVFILFCIFSCASISVAQGNIYTTTDGHITFKSVAPLETIIASSSKLEGAIGNDDLSFAFIVPILSFNGFNNGLQRQHFYENYLEASKYPEASFTGKIIEAVDFTQPGRYEVRAKGHLNIHGRTKERIIRIVLVCNGTDINAKAQFMIPLMDHQIEVPKIVNQKIAQEIQVTVSAMLSLTTKT